MSDRGKKPAGKGVRRRLRLTEAWIEVLLARITDLEIAVYEVTQEDEHLQLDKDSN